VATAAGPAGPARCRLAKNSVCQPAVPQMVSAFTGGSAIGGVVVVGVGGVMVVGVMAGVVVDVGGVVIGGVVIGTGVGGSV
jgi:hypothetical protein